MTAVVAVGIAMPAADAAKTKTLGKTEKTPKASCPTPKGNDFPPRKGCQALGEVTGFQKKADGKKDLFEVPKAGTIVGWGVKMSKPSKKEQDFFDEVLGDEGGGKPLARLALLSKADGSKYRLRAQSPKMGLRSELGNKVTYTLNDPIPVQKKWIVGITTPTWVPNFAHDLEGHEDSWQASRTKKRCEGEKNLTERSKPHKGVGTTRVYNCSYQKARLLYWAYFVPN